jgi:signal peptidase II
MTPTGQAAHQAGDSPTSPPAASAPPREAGRSGRPYLALGLVLAALIVVVDQISKIALLMTMEELGGRFVEVTSFFSIVLVMNRGVSFGMFNNAEAGLGGLVFSLLAAAIVIMLLVWLWRARSMLIALGTGLVIGGAIGNVLDRLRLGAVVDFLDFHLGTWHWPAFNAADSAICIGVALLVLDGLLGRGQKST